MAYSQRLYTAVSQADMKMLGVRLGAVCIDAKIPVQVIARWMGISRQGVYLWFTGATDVADRHREKVESLIDVLLDALEENALPVPKLARALEIVEEYQARGR